MSSIIDKEKIDAILNQAKTNDLVHYIEKSFIAYSDGSAVVPPPGMLSFDEPRGDVHIKFGYIKGEEIYAVKVASGFYDNAKLGLSVGNGLILVFNAKTGQLMTILLDDGVLTDVRTAIAAMVVVKHYKPNQIKKIGLIGSGLIGSLMIDYIGDIVDCKDVLVLGRSEEKLEKFKSSKSHLDLNINITTDSKKLISECNLILTATPAKSPVIFADGLMQDSLIVALGADTVGKQELDAEILIKSDLILMDSQSQCEHHGEIHIPFQDGLLQGKQMREIGTALKKQLKREKKQIIVADLTGIATQDIQISKFALENL